MTKPRIAIPIPTSFDAEYNQVSWPQYAAAVERFGGVPVAVSLGEPEAVAELIETCAGVLLPGSGADVAPHRYGEQPSPYSAAPDPMRESVDLQLLQSASAAGKPILTICFGTQMLNVWRGGSLIQHLPDDKIDHRQRGVVAAHEAEIAPDSLIAAAAEAERPLAPGEPILLAVNSSHHQAIASAGEGLRISGRSVEDGVVEAVEGPSPGPFLVGVQWHPERTIEESAASRALFERFISEAADWTAADPHKPLTR